MGSDMLWKRNLEGPLEHPDLIYVDNDALTKVYHSCTEEELQGPHELIERTGRGTSRFGGVE